MKKTPKNRGRIQAQGDGLEESESWSTEEPPTWEEGISMVETLKNKLSRRELADRKKPFEDAERFIRRAGENDGVPAQVSKSFSNKKNRRIRVDIEIIAGIAFIASIFIFVFVKYLL